jgi:L-threonylcarbamoyladenylate synthase
MNIFKVKSITPNPANPKILQILIQTNAFEPTAQKFLPGFAGSPRSINISNLQSLRPNPENPKILKILIYLWLMTDFETDVQNCLGVLKTGGVILYPTDSVWGLGCDATDEQAVEKIFRLKQRPANKSMVILVADERDVLKYVTQPDLRVFEYLKTTTTPTTVIYPGAVGLAENAVSGDGSVAIRITRELFTRTLVKRFRKPLVSTSANLSGEPSPAIYKDISGVIKNGVDYTVRYRQEEKSQQNHLHSYNGTATPPLQ